MKKVFLCIFIGGWVLAFSSLAMAGGAVSIQWGDDSKPLNDRGNYSKKGGPPPHAKAYGYRAKHQYRYYPCRDVYHDPGRGMYFYLKGSGWEVGASLPTSLQEDLGAFVSLELDTDKPYEHHPEHVKQYPKERFKPGKTGKK